MGGGGVLAVQSVQLMLVLIKFKIHLPFCFAFLACQWSNKRSMSAWTAEEKVPEQHSPWQLAPALCLALRDSY